ncbi:MAG: hypothetical protein K0Q97_686, partial [Bacillota bacterium]|nr:hypothetical protein [Bacillota bacterium]
MFLKNHEELVSTSNIFRNSLDKQRVKVIVCGGTGCVAGGSLLIYDKLKEMVSEKGLLVDVDLYLEEEGIGVKKSGCHGFCEVGPLVRVEPYNYLYLKVSLSDCEDIFNHTIMNSEPVKRLMYSDDERIYQTQDEIPFYQKQTRLVLENCGTMDAENIQEYIGKGGYRALANALKTMEPKEICKQIQDSGLRGRGGGGYLAGKKWSQVLAQNKSEKYIVCNGDEGDPGAFMDRSIMEGDPHKVIEGMMLGGFATGAKTGYIYVRAEYPLAVERLRIAIEQAKEYGLLGKNILNSGFDFELHINKGAGAFVCGE